MRRLLFGATLACAAVIAPAASADLEIVDIPFLWSVNNGNETLPVNIPQFDDMEGTRFLNAITISFVSDYSCLMIAENLEATPVLSGEWFCESVTFMDLTLGGEPGAILGTAFYGLLTGDLAAADGVSQEGPDSMMALYEGQMSGSWDVPFGYIPGFVGTETTPAGLYPFLSLAINAPPPLFDLWIVDHQHQGTLTVTYEFTAGGPPCICEMDDNGVVDVFDLLAYLDLWFAGDFAANLNGDLGVDVFDLLFFLDCWFIGCE